MLRKTIVSNLLVTFSAAIFGILGLVHLLITFIGNRMHPKNPELIELMKDGALVIDPSTNAWRGWIGFNASHSLGMILFGCIYGFLSLVLPKVFFGSYFLIGVGALTLLGFLVLAKKYWFNIPFFGVGISLILYISGIVLGIS